MITICITVFVEGRRRTIGAVSSIVPRRADVFVAARDTPWFANVPQPIQ